MFIAGTESSGAASCTTSATFAKRRKSHNDPYPLDGARKFDPDGTTVTSRTAVAACNLIRECGIARITAVTAAAAKRQNYPPAP
ncbi:hypothetical protein Aam_011_005 [Acidocella aminolytica 101 = DSM 11237]|uniref:Uncharacterized protein n=1 Tax=Acidocella aminolytica 101 = DSM 11237 TaxID=1120923 RepID=A0A0D6PDD6_9PROT|nr:hypothetical protein Aam_011_005 [Acidocella aminolytica 101 = DSM 11237]